MDFRGQEAASPLLQASELSGARLGNDELLLVWGTLTANFLSRQSKQGWWKWL